MFTINRDKEDLISIYICDADKEHIYHSNGIDFVILYEKDKEIYCADEDQPTSIFMMSKGDRIKVLKKLSKDEYKHIVRLSKGMKE